MQQAPIIISVGGSLIVPDGIDTDFLASLKALIERELAVGQRFVIITGGGRTARTYQDAARTVTELTAEDLDWLGIHSSRLNAHLVRTVFFAHAHPEVITNPDEVPSDQALVIAAGYRPGASTDLRAVQIAVKLGAEKVINLSNINYVYDKDPKVHGDAVPIHESTWADFRALLPSEWDPGLSAPFDPVAAKEAEAHELEVAVLNGSYLGRLEQYLEGKPFEGTVIR
ncbi:UMP kinase [Patescibacteria group bacterium]|jgi:uridylate kinase|nr:UMP kinase [Patescibacteria group bacterium]